MGDKKPETWRLTFHCCRLCCGRILYRRVSPKKFEIICAKCGVRMSTKEISDLCFCGVEAGTYGKIFECIENPDRRPELPNVVVVVEKKIDFKQKEIRPSRKVYVPDEFEDINDDDE